MQGPEIDSRLRRLEVLTLELERAQGEEDLSVSLRLLEERERLLEALESTPPSSIGLQTLERIRDVDTRLLQTLGAEVEALKERLCAENSSKKARAAYKGRDSDAPHLLEWEG